MPVNFFLGAKLAAVFSSETFPSLGGIPRKCFGKKRRLKQLLARKKLLAWMRNVFLRRCQMRDEEGVNFSGFDVATGGIIRDFSAGKSRPEKFTPSSSESKSYLETKKAPKHLFAL